MQLLSLVMSAVMASAAPAGNAPASSTVLDLYRALTSPERRVRTHDARVASALFDGVRRSRTFADLIAALEGSNVITYVELVQQLPPLVEGRLALASKGNAQRYVRIQVRATLPADMMISTIGHELQHAIEIARAPSVRDEAGLRKLYQQIGVGRSDVNGFDTEAARVAGEQVKRELRAFSKRYFAALEAAGTSEADRRPSAAGPRNRSGKSRPS
jgi:hypothetical protein